MTWDTLLLIVIWLALTSTVLTIYIRVHASEWGLIGLAILLAGAWVLVTRSLLHEWEVEALRREQLLLWRWMAGIGAVIVLAGQIASLQRDPPPIAQVVRRLAVAVVVMAAIVLALSAYVGD